MIMMISIMIIVQLIVMIIIIIVIIIIVVIIIIIISIIIVVVEGGDGGRLHQVPDLLRQSGLPPGGQGPGARDARPGAVRLAWRDGPQWP